jgi:hypothetical protein
MKTKAVLCDAGCEFSNFNSFNFPPVLTCRMGVLPFSLGELNLVRLEASEQTNKQIIQHFEITQKTI